ncbi:E3 SUMO-protein ligase [Wickerhamomyces ciferrii]|uniref:E3 SUMO-protein ligase n=1 Tax=Wickerhamomyces ciferrii (strain ATCC 14091 / BCRC 22168 / CBS 111 / JCM 3599 / NBRC 0793 / NRRL Y-1031 F-60-10) TaxID=1206466 RepID=K0KMC0_WICCF|nr:E3 SUMO-protein ligase [Wickerhamomyces ciferrii]CCH42524.1 E3 SUMO-protein ligase [Wickerhamomyces ciferrii]
MSQGIELPTYFPISEHVLPDFEGLRSNSNALNELRETQSEILKAANTYFESLFPEDSSVQWNVEESGNVEIIKSLLESFEKLSRAQQQTKFYNDVFETTRSAVRNRARNEPELSLRNIDMYKKADPDKKSFSQLLEERLSNPPTFKVNSNNPDFIFLKNATFVIDHPLDPLPDEEEDDDLQIGGGKIDLKCPISMNIFESPMLSKKCSHTIDQKSLFGIWKSPNSTEDCPILGCSKTLRRADFVPDRLMALRVKSYKAQQERLENAEDYDRLE